MIKEVTTAPKSETLTLGSEESFRLLVESVKDYAIIMLDPGGHIVTWNAGAECLKGYHAEEIIGKHFSSLYPTDAIQRGVPEQELKIAVKEGRFEDEGWRLRKDGKQFWASVIISSLRDKDGTLCGFSKVTRDLTERKKAEEIMELVYTSHAGLAGRGGRAAHRNARQPAHPAVHGTPARPHHGDQFTRGPCGHHGSACD